MGDEFQLGSGSWWDNTRNRSFDSGTTPNSIPTTLNTIASFASWPTEMAADMNKSSSTTASGDRHDQSSNGGVLADQNLQMMGLGLSSQNLDWNQALFSRGEKVESSFRSLLQEDLGSNSGGFQQKLYSGPSSEDSISANEFKQINRPGFSLDQTAPFSSQASSNDSTITSGQNLTTGFQVDFHGMLLSENQQQQSTYQNRSSMNYPYPSSGGYSANAVEFIPSVNKYPQFLRTSQPPPTAASSGSHLHFTNKTPFWNASAPPAAMADARSSFFPAGLQTHQIPTPPSFDEKLKNNTSDIVGEMTKKNSTETSNKRPRGKEAAAATPLPAFKERKEKMGDRITALQQLVSPFGKTDTASVLSEAIAYIDFLHEQVNVLSNPYLKNGAPIQYQQNSDKSKDPEGPRQELRSRGLCLVPVSSTLPMTHETTVDFWTPTFGGTFR